MICKILPMALGILFACCIISCDLSYEPESPAIKGVFLNTKTIPSILGNRKAIISHVIVGQSKGSGFGGYKYVQGADIMVDGRKYKFYLDSSRNVDFGILSTEETSWTHWNYSFKNDQANNKYLYLDVYSPTLRNIDTIPPELYGYAKDVDLFFFLAIITDAKKVLNPSYYKSIKEFEMIEFGYTDLYETIRTYYHYDVNRKVLYYEEDSLTSGRIFDDRVREIGELVSQSSTVTNYIEKIFKKHYMGHKNKNYIPNLSLTENIVEPGDSVSFTGRISGDSVIAY